MVPVIDLFLILFLFGFIFYGFFFGLIRTVGSLLAMVLALWIAGYFYQFLFLLIKSWFLGYDSFGKSLAYIILFTIANRLIMLGFRLLETTYNLISIIPFLKTINRLGGAIFGFLEGSIVLSVALYFVASHADLPLIGGYIMDLFALSKMAVYFIKFAAYLSPFLPVIMDKLASIA